MGAGWDRGPGPEGWPLSVQESPRGLYGSEEQARNYEAVQATILDQVA